LCVLKPIVSPPFLPLPQDGSSYSERIQPQNLGTYLEKTFPNPEQPSDKLRYWIIVKGYDDTVMSRLGFHFKIHEEMYQVGRGGGGVSRGGKKERA